MRECEEKLKSVHLRRALRLVSRQRWHACEACRGAEESRQLFHYRTKLPIWLARDSFQSRGRVTKTPYLLETWHFEFHTYPTINTLIPTKCRELPERILREKPWRKTRSTHPQSSSFNTPNSSTLTFSIDTSLRGTLTKILISPYPYMWEGYLVLGKQFKRDQFILVAAMGDCGIQ